MERLQKVIADSGYTSRRKAEELIKNGRVKVNGILIREMGFKVNFDDLIEIDNEEYDTVAESGNRYGFNRDVESV